MVDNTINQPITFSTKDLATMPIGALMLLAMVMAKSDEMDLRARGAVLNQTNQDMQALATIMTRMRSAVADNATNAVSLSASDKALLKRLGIDLQESGTTADGVKYCVWSTSVADINKNIDLVQSKLDGLNSLSQTQTTDFKSLEGKYTEWFTLITTFQKSQNDTAMHTISAIQGA